MLTAETINSTISETGKVSSFMDVKMVKKRHDVMKHKIVTNSPKKLRQRTKELIVKALDAVASGKM